MVDVIILLRVMVNSNIVIAQYDSEDNTLMMMDTRTVIQVCNV